MGPPLVPMRLVPLPEPPLPEPPLGPPLVPTRQVPLLLPPSPGWRALEHACLLPAAAGHDGLII